jgi:hypothetical protein
MGKFDRYEARQVKQEKVHKIHPVWRGIGCLMIIIIPVMAYAAADVFLQAAPGLGLFPRSSDIYRNIDLEFYIAPISLGMVVFTILFAMVGFLLFSVLYSIVYRMAGPPRYGPTDAPPPKRTKSRR